LLRGVCVVAPRAKDRRQAACVSLAARDRGRVVDDLVLEREHGQLALRAGQLAQLFLDPLDPLSGAWMIGGVQGAGCDRVLDVLEEQLDRVGHDSTLPCTRSSEIQRAGERRQACTAAREASSPIWTSASSSAWEIRTCLT